MKNFNKVARDFVDWYRQKKPEYKSWHIEYFLPTTRIKITVPEGVDIDEDYKLTKIVGLGFRPPDFKNISRLLSARALASLLFSENLWLVDKEQKHHMIVGYIVRETKTVVLLQFWLRAEGMYDIIGNSPIGIVLFPTKTESKAEASEKVAKIVQSGMGEYKLIVADLEPFKYEEPMKI